jgi:hypothetical protein
MSNQFVETIGKIHDARTCIIAGTCTGTATCDKVELELMTAGWGGQGPPVVYCPSTNKYFSLSWDNVINLAKAAGILEPWTDSPKTRKKARKS